IIEDYIPNIYSLHIHILFDYGLLKHRIENLVKTMTMNVNSNDNFIAYNPDDKYYEQNISTPIFLEQHFVIFLRIMHLTNQLELLMNAVNFNINHNALDGLLVILKKKFQHYHNFLKIHVCLTTINPGLYYHFGLKSAILEHFKYISSNNIDVIKIVIGIDGLPISKSSASQLWPILAIIPRYINMK
ncbi:Uncharacterized protein FWK35_00029272, partial [Aphis craccivora]